MAQVHIDVMISSTRKDLEAHRKHIEDAILRLSMFPVGMERMGAADSDAIKESLHMVDISEVYLGIFGMRYGFVPEDSRNPNKISITEMEYRRAVERDIPILIFIMDEDHPVTAKDTEMDSDSLAKLNALKAEMLGRHIVATFKSSEELRYLAIQSLQRVKDEAAKRIGENDPGTLEIKDDLIIPPELLALPRYTLTANFIGRQRELGLLDSWSKSIQAMMVVEAIGGIGKSALTWEWVNSESQADDYEGRFWYSFYDGGTNMQSFLRDAVAYFRRVAPKEVMENRAELEKELMMILDTRRVLLILDGLERVLVAYHRFDAAHIHDDQVAEEKHKRATTDPKDGRFLKQMAVSKKGKVLLSSRLMPLSLEDAEHIAHEKLSGLAPDDAYKLMLDRGVKAPENPKLMDDFMAQFGYHGLLLTITAGRIKFFRANPGNFEMWYQVFGKDLRDPDLQKARLKLLEYAFEGLEENAQKFLNEISAFQDAIPYSVVAIFNPYRKAPPEAVSKPDLDDLELYQQWKAEGKHEYDAEISLLTREKDQYETYLRERESYEKFPGLHEYFDNIPEFHNLLTELSDRGLLNWERNRNYYDLHPVIRGHCFDQLEGEEKERVHNKIHNHFKNIPVNFKTAKSIHDIFDAIMVYRSLIGKGCFEEAAIFYRGSGYALTDTLLYKLNANNLVINLLSDVFTNGLDTFPPFDDDKLKAYITVAIAVAFQRAGQVSQALSLQHLLIKLDTSNKVPLELSNSLSYYIDCLASKNQMALAVRNAVLGLGLSQLEGDNFDKCLSHALLLRYHNLVGKWQQAEKHNCPVKEDAALEGVFHFFLAEKAFYLGRTVKEDLDEAWQKLEKTRNLQWAAPIWALRARDYLRLGQIDEALIAIDVAIEWANKQTRAEHASYLATRGLIWSQMDTMDEAQKDVDTAIETNLYPSEFAHIYNCASRVYQKIGSLEKARSYAIEAYTYAWADGAPYVRWYDLQEAKKQLDSLGLEHPQLDPYDTENPEKVYMEDEIVALIEELKAEKDKKDAESDDYDPFGDES